MIERVVGIVAVPDACGVHAIQVCATYFGVWMGLYIIVVGRRPAEEEEAVCSSSVSVAV